MIHCSYHHHHHRCSYSFHGNCHHGDSQVSGYDVVDDNHAHQTCQTGFKPCPLFSYCRTHFLYECLVRLAYLTDSDMLIIQGGCSCFVSINRLIRSHTTLRFLSLKKDVASPKLPTLPVLPIRCMYSSMSLGRS